MATVRYALYSSLARKQRVGYPNMKLWTLSLALSRKVCLNLDLCSHVLMACRSCPRCLRCAGQGSLAHCSLLLSVQYCAGVVETRKSGRPAQWKCAFVWSHSISDFSRAKWAMHFFRFGSTGLVGDGVALRAPRGLQYRGDAVS